jgi:hypothetical protein
VESRVGAVRVQTDYGYGFDAVRGPMI